MTSIGKEPFGSHEGKTVDLYTLTSTDGATVKISSYGGIITSWTVPDRSGKQTDIVLGFKNLASYTSPSYLATCPYFGALIGRYGNRIGGARFSLNGIEYQLAPNDGPNNLHGGPKGFDKRVWDGADEAVGDDAALTLEYVSAAGEEGFPGKLSTTVVYTVQSGGVLRIDYSATTDRTTIANLTQHTYFNLAGEGNGDILGTELEINASRFTPVDANLIATGELRSVEGTPFDFRRATAIGARVNQKDQQLGYGEGYDHNFVIDRGSEMGLVLAARAYEPVGGRVLEVFTTEPGVQLYVGNHLDGSLVGKSGKPYTHRSGFCLETQHYPDSPNKPGFPSVTLERGETYATTTIFKFSAR
jgi:aldose 1-epimerase